MIKSLKERAQIRFDDRFLIRTPGDELTSDLLVALSLFDKREQSTLSNLEKLYPGVVSAQGKGAQMRFSQDHMNSLVRTHFSGTEAEMISDIFSRVPYGYRVHIIVDHTKQSIVCRKYTCAKFPVCSVISSGEECTNAFVLPYDGYIESASELSRFTNLLSQSKLHVFCGGISKEAIQDLKRCKNLWIHTVSTDVGNIATIGDIATSCSASIRNYHTGELLITIDPSSLTAVEAIRTCENSVEIESEAGIKSSGSLISDLMQRRASSTEDGVKLIDTRLSRLSSKRFEIITSSRRIANKLSQFVRELSACISSGCSSDGTKVYPYIASLASEKIFALQFVSKILSVHDKE
jgi:hypothetical protein